jgi:predicted RNA methylase
MAIVVLILAASAVGDETLFAPSSVNVIGQALQEANIKENDVLYDLGCGDGRVCIIASKGFGCRSVGIELDKDVVEQAKNNVKLNKLDNLVRIYQGDILKTDFSQATIVYVYLMPELSEKLLPTLKRMKGLKTIIAYDKPIPKLEVSKQISVKDEEGNVQQVYYYESKKINWPKIWSN